MIDYSTRQGLAIYSQSVRPLYEDPADLFNVDSAGLQTFLSLLQLRGSTCGWDFSLPEDPTMPLIGLKNLIACHGQFTLENITQFAVSYVNTHTRAAQENMQMVKCILSSLSLPGFRKIQTWHTAWHVTHRNRPSAFCLIKVIIREAYIDTQATTRILRSHLSTLPAKLEELKGDIEALNAYVKLTQDQLLARGETSNDLLANLFLGYLSSRDATFRRYMEKKQEDYDEGAIYTVDSLMSLASNKYKTLIEAGKWMAPSDDQAKIIALEAKMSKMGQRSTHNSGKGGNTNPKANNSGKAPKQQKKKPKDIPAWMTKWPGKEFVDANKSKTVEGKTYWWCKIHKRFTMHKSNECRLAKSPSSKPDDKRGNTPGGGPTPPSNSTPSIRVSTATLMNE